MGTNPLHKKCYTFVELVSKPIHIHFMNKEKKATKKAEHERITMAMTKSERMAALKKAFEEKRAAEALAKRAALKEEKRKKGLAHYLTKVTQQKKRT